MNEMLHGQFYRFMTDEQRTGPFDPELRNSSCTVRSHALRLPGGRVPDPVFHFIRIAFHRNLIGTITKIFSY
jgi:hypothetical protein